MIQRLKFIILSLTAVVMLSVYATSTVSAIDLFPGCADGDTSKVCTASGKDNVAGLIANIISVLLYFIGAAAVIMIVIGGIKYVTSQGDANNMQSAKNTILYSVLGLIAAIAAQALVAFVVEWFS